jgi:hypothetical protein
MALIVVSNRFGRASMAAFALALVALGLPQVRAGMIVGVDVEKYVILYQGAGGRHLHINNFGTTGVWTGDIGIAGTGTLQASGPGTHNGNIDFAAANSGQANVHNTTVIGTTNYNESVVQSIMNELNTLSSNLGALAGSGTRLAINTNSAQTILVSTGALVEGTRLFNVNSVNTKNGQNLIIKGDGSQSVVFDVNTPGHAQFHGNILLQDMSGKMYGDAGYAGLGPDQVLFNLFDGDTLDVNNNGNQAHPNNIIYGTFLDPNGAVSFVNTRIVGRIFGGDSHNMQIVSGDTIALPAGLPAAPLPPTIVLVLAGTVPRGLASRCAAGISASAFGPTDPRNCERDCAARIRMQRVRPQSIRTHFHSALPRMRPHSSPKLGMDPKSRKCVCVRCRRALQETATACRAP